MNLTRTPITSLDKTGLLEMNWRDHTDAPLTMDDILHAARALDCYWSCAECPTPYHAQLSSDVCSPDFLDLKRAMLACQPFRELLAYNLARLLADRGWTAGLYDTVTGSASGSTELVRSISKITGVHFIEMVKDLDGGQLVAQDQPLCGDEMVAQFEELSTTYGTPVQVRRALREAYNGVTLVPFVAMVIDRHENEDCNPVLPDGSAVISLARLPSKLYRPGPETCPMCAAGSVPIRPRHESNWALLTSMAPIAQG